MATITITISGDQDDAVISDLGRFLMRRVPAPAEGQVTTATRPEKYEAQRGLYQSVEADGEALVVGEKKSPRPVSAASDMVGHSRTEDTLLGATAAQEETEEPVEEPIPPKETKIPTDAELVQAVTLAARALGGGAAGGVPRIEAWIKTEYGIPGIMAAAEEERVRILEDLGKIAEGKIVPPEIVLPSAVKPPTQADVIAAADKALLTALGGERVGKTEAEVAAKRKAINAAVRLHTKATALKDVAAEHRPEVILFLKGIASGEIKV